MAAFEYEREDYQDNLKRIKRVGTYQDYENAIYEMNELKKDIVASLPAHPIPHIDNIVCIIDQVDNVYWGDIGFHTDTLLDESDIYFIAGIICAELRERAEECWSYSMYYNQCMQMFMYTKVCIEANDGPDLYAGQERTFVLR